MKDKTDTILVSIAMCTYNGEKYLHEQLDSLVYQDYSNLEIIIIDDCSSDQTLDILKDYSNRFSFIKVFQNESNLGYVKNFERAISKCSGEYIALSDQDDIWELHKISTLCNNIKDHTLIYHDSDFVNELGNSLNKKVSDIINLYEGGDFRPFLFENCISGHSMLFKRSLVGRLLPFNESYFHDWWIAYIASNYGTIGLIKENLVHYRQHNDAATDILKSKPQKEENRLRGCDQELIFKKVTHCKTYSNPRNHAFIDHLHQLMAKRLKSKGFSFELFMFLLNNMNGLFYIYKKSFFSKLNFIRKINRAYKY